MTNIDLVLETLEELMPSSYCDDCFSEQLGITPRQQVNAICNKLNSQGLILRTKALCPHCGRRKLVNSLKETFESRILDEEMQAFAMEEPLDSVEKLGDESKSKSVATPAIEQPSFLEYAVKAESPSFLDIEHIRTEIVRMCRHLWHNHRKDPRPYSISKIINALREDNTIPSHQANMMLTICGLRNVFVYESLSLGPNEMAVTRGAWRIILDWWNNTSAK